ncbi:MAG: hypothetical protein M3P23_09220 [Actinomycetota bacterium]|nr:hypothetical protein [Actinomycetota bacterium]
MADRVDAAGLGTARAVHRARRRLVRSAAIVSVVVAVAVYGGSAAVQAIGGVKSPQHPKPAGVACSSNWKVVPTPNLGSENSEFAGVAAIVRDDVWAVGYHYKTRPHYHPFIEHWDGSSWSIVKAPAVEGYGLLQVASAVSTDDVWAAGFAGGKTLILHYDGSAWSQVPTPATGSPSYLGSVVAISSDDAWAVGSQTIGGRSTTLILHWDGRSWTVVPSPNGRGAFNTLNAASAVAPDDVWAAGSYGRSESGAQRTLTMRWDGSTWGIVASPSSARTETLTDISAVSAADVWTVGGTLDQQAFTEHWDGSQWTEVPSAVQDAILIGVTAVAANDVYSTGWYEETESLIQHWDGSSWTIVPSPSPGSDYNSLGKLTKVGQDIWAVGTTEDGGMYQPLAERSCSAG